MVYSAASDLDAVFEASTVTWTAGKPTIFRDTEDEPDFVDDDGVTAAKGYIKILTGKMSDPLYFSQHRYDPWVVRVEISFDDGVGTETKVLALCRNIHDAIDLENTGTLPRKYKYSAKTEDYNNTDALMFISMREELIVLAT